MVLPPASLKHRFDAYIISYLKPLTMNLIAKITVALTLISMTSCIIDKKDDGIPDMPAKATFGVKIDKMSALKSCEGEGTSGTADLYTKITMYKRESLVSELELLAETENILVGLKRYETVENPGIELNTEVEVKDGLIIASIITTYEQDPNGKRQISRSFSQTFIYEEDLGCWIEDSNACAFGTTPGTSNLNRAEESKMIDRTCDVTYFWSTFIQTQ